MLSGYGYCETYNEIWTGGSSMMRMLAVDPGELHVGHAHFVDDDVIDCGVNLPEVAIDRFWTQLAVGQFDIVVCEQWRNFDSNASTWSECLTAEVIGAIRHKCRQLKVPFHKQPSLILRPGRARMKRYGVTMPDMSHIEPGLRNHAESATIHGYWYRFENGLVAAA